MMNEYETWLSKVVKVADFKYEISKDVLENYNEELTTCYEQNFSPIRTVEVVASQLFE